MQEPSWIFILLVVTALAVIVAAGVSRWRTAHDQKKQVQSNLNHKH